MPRIEICPMRSNRSDMPVAMLRILFGVVVGLGGCGVPERDSGAQPDAPGDGSQDGCQLDLLHSGAPGTDGAWGTADDPIIKRTVMSFDGAGLRRTSIAYEAGPDGTWKTGDDVIVSVELTDFESPFERPAQILAYDDAGPDGIWKTNDDHARSRMSLTYDQGRMVDQTSYMDPGADATWSTSDDKISSWGSFANFVTDAQPGESRFHRDPGPDMTWGNPDDPIDALFEYDWQVPALFLRLFHHRGPGPDSVWGTQDDEIGSRADYECDGGELFKLTVYSDPGTDGLWGTVDDQVSSVQALRFVNSCAFNPCTAIIL